MSGTVVSVLCGSKRLQEIVISLFQLYITHGIEAWAFSEIMVIEVIGHRSFVVLACKCE